MVGVTMKKYITITFLALICGYVLAVIFSSSRIRIYQALGCGSVKSEKYHGYEFTTVSCGLDKHCAFLQRDNKTRAIFSADENDEVYVDLLDGEETIAKIIDDTSSVKCWVPQKSGNAILSCEDGASIHYSDSKVDILYRDANFDGVFDSRVVEDHSSKKVTTSIHYNDSWIEVGAIVRSKAKSTSTKQSFVFDYDEGWKIDL